VPQQVTGMTTHSLFALQLAQGVVPPSLPESTAASLPESTAESAAASTPESVPPCELEQAEAHTNISSDMSSAARRTMDRRIFHRPFDCAVLCRPATLVTA